MSINLGDRSVIITGAGAGLGRSHALYLASLGALVVVNDLNEEAARSVVEEITAAGGVAHAAPGSVTDPLVQRSLVDAAVFQFGHLDVIVNNAGVTRDGAFHKMDPEDIDLVLDIHLRSALHLVRQAWPHLRERPAARIINTASDSGLYGNFGQANYGAAKMGLVGMIMSLADEGRSRGVCANAIVPVAYTEMTKELFGQFDVTPEMLGPQWVSPLVAFLASEDCTETGGIWNCAGGIVGFTRVVETLGKRFSLEQLTPDAIADSLGAIKHTNGEWTPVSMNDKVAGVHGGIYNLFGRLTGRG